MTQQNGSSLSCEQIRETLFPCLVGTEVSLGGEHLGQSPLWDGEVLMEQSLTPWLFDSHHSTFDHLRRCTNHQCSVSLTNSSGICNVMESEEKCGQWTHTCRNFHEAFTDCRWWPWPFEWSKQVQVSWGLLRVFHVSPVMFLVSCSSYTMSRSPAVRGQHSADICI